MHDEVQHDSRGLAEEAACLSMGRQHPIHYRLDFGISLTKLVRKSGALLLWRVHQLGIDGPDPFPPFRGYRWIEV